MHHVRLCCVVPQGKTLQVISLMLAQPPAGTSYISKARAVEENKRLLEQLENVDATASKVRKKHMTHEN